MVFFFAAFLIPLAFSTALAEHFLLPKAAFLAAAGLAALAAAGPREARVSAGPFILLAGFLAATVTRGLHPQGLPALLTAAGGAALAAAAGSETRRAIPLATCAAVFAVTGYGFLQLAGADPLPWDPADLGGRTGLFSTLGNVNWLAGWLALAAPLLLAGLAGSRGATKAAYGVGLALSLTLLFATRSRAALLAVGGAAVWLSLRHPAPRRRKAVWGFALLFALLAVDFAVRLGGGYSLADRLRFAGAGLADRAELWNIALAMVAAAGPLGEGAGGFARRYPDFLAASGDVGALARAGFARHTHNDFLQVAAEAGALGFTGFLWILVGGLVASARAGDAEAACAGATLAAAIPLALLDTVLFHPALWLTVILAHGFHPREPPPEPTAPDPVGLLRPPLPPRPRTEDHTGGPEGRGPSGGVRGGAPPVLFNYFIILVLIYLLILSLGALRSSHAHAAGRHALARGERAVARAAFAEAARLDPRHAEAEYLAGALALEAGDLPDAAVRLRRAAERLSEPGLFLDLALAAERGAFPGGGSPRRLAARWRGKAAALFHGPELVGAAYALFDAGETWLAERALLRCLRLDDAADRLNLGLTPLLDRLIARRLEEPSAALFALLAERARHAVAARLARRP